MNASARIVCLKLSAMEAFRLVDLFAFMTFFGTLDAYLPDTRDRAAADRGFRRIARAMAQSGVSRHDFSDEELEQVRDAMESGCREFVLPRFRGVSLTLPMLACELLTIVRLWKLLEATGTLHENVDPELETSTILALYTLERFARRAGLDTELPDEAIAAALVDAARGGLLESTLDDRRA